MQWLNIIEHGVGRPMREGVLDVTDITIGSGGMQTKVWNCNENEISD